MYEHNTIGDKNFGVNPQVLAVLELLAQQEPYFAKYNDKMKEYDVTFKTYPWYNGREQGVSISMNPAWGMNGKKTLHIAIFEHRNSDRLCCLKWESDYFYVNAPCQETGIYNIAYKGGSKWDLDATFAPNEIGKCTDWIMTQMEEFYNK